MDGFCLRNLIFFFPLCLTWPGDFDFRKGNRFLALSNCYESFLFFSSAVKKDTATEMAKKREQERHRQEKLAETNQLSRYRRRSHSRSRSPPRYLPCFISRNLSSILYMLIHLCDCLRY